MAITMTKLSYSDYSNKKIGLDDHSIKNLILLKIPYFNTYSI